MCDDPAFTDAGPAPCSNWDRDSYGKNVLAAYSSALHHAELIKGKLRALMTSQNRHGDLMAVRSAVINLNGDLTILIDDEEAETQKAGAPTTRTPARCREPLQTAIRIP